MNNKIVTEVTHGAKHESASLHHPLLVALGTSHRSCQWFVFLTLPLCDGQLPGAGYVCCCNSLAIIIMTIRWSESIAIQTRSAPFVTLFITIFCYIRHVPLECMQKYATYNYIKLIQRINSTMHMRVYSMYNYCMQLFCYFRDINMLAEGDYMNNKYFVTSDMCLSKNTKSAKSMLQIIISS